MCAILLAEPALSARRFNRLRLIPFTILIFAVAFSDPLAVALLLAPLILLVILRAWLNRVFRLDEWLLALSVLIGAFCGLLTLHRLNSGGGFTTSSDVSLNLVPDVFAVLHNLHAMLGGCQVLFTARAVLIKTLPLHHVIAATRQITAGIVGIVCFSVFWQMPRTLNAGVAQLLILGAACLTLTAVISTTFGATVSTGIGFPGAAVRFGVPVFVFLCLAAALQGQALLAKCPVAGQRLIIIIGLCFSAISAVGAIAAAHAAAVTPAGIRAAPQAVLTKWLEENGLHYGVGDYWDTQMIHALSGGQVIADPATELGGRILLFPLGDRHNPLWPKYTPAIRCH